VEGKHCPSGRQGVGSVTGAQCAFRDGVREWGGCVQKKPGKGFAIVSQKKKRMKTIKSQVRDELSQASKTGKEKTVAKPYKMKRFYTPKDVVVHNTSNDLWVSFFHEVYDITKLIQENFTSPLVDPIVSAAGTDITYWFDPKTKEPKTCVDARTGLTTYYLPQGRYLHVPSSEPSSQPDPIFKEAWWKDKQYCIGHLTKKVRKIKIVNMLTAHEDVLEVPCEETINEILERYKEINSHAASYTWKRLGRPLEMESTLDENDILDETDEFERLEIDQEEWYIPAIHLYFNDDLTVA